MIKESFSWSPLWYLGLLSLLTSNRKGMKGILKSWEPFQVEEAKALLLCFRSGSCWVKPQGMEAEDLLQMCKELVKSFRSKKCLSPSGSMSKQRGWVWKEMQDEQDQFTMLLSATSSLSNYIVPMRNIPGFSVHLHCFRCLLFKTPLQYQSVYCQIYRLSRNPQAQFAIR